MKRGELYRVFKPGKQDPKKSRVFVVVSRDALIASKFSSVICAPVYSRFDGLSTQVLVSIDEGLKHESAIHCDELISLPKAVITNFIGTLSLQKIKELDISMKIALAIDEIN